MKLFSQSRFFTGTVSGVGWGGGVVAQLLIIHSAEETEILNTKNNTK